MIKSFITKTRWLVTIILLTTLSISYAWGSSYSVTMDQNAKGNNNVHITTTTANSYQDVTYSTITWRVAWAGTGAPGQGSKSQVQFGTGSTPCSSITISTSGISGTITSVSVTCGGASSNNATVGVSVGGTALKNGNNTSLSVGTTVNAKTFSGTASGTITISISQSTSKAIYVSGVSVTYYPNTTVALDKNGGDADGSATYVYNATGPASFSGATRAGYNCTGYWTDASSGSQVLTANGSFSTSSRSGWYSSGKWNRDNATGTLYARWEAASSCGTPTVGAPSNSSVSVNTATVSCTGITKNDCDIEEWGFYYKTGSSGVTTSDTKHQVSAASSSTSVGSYSWDMTSLTANTHYYVKAYAIVDGVTTLSSSETDFTTCKVAAPNHVDITPTAEAGNYGYRYTIGETIKLTATAYSSAGTGSPIAAANITGYQWQKLVNSTWTDLANGTTDGVTIAGATSANLSIATCKSSNTGNYRCIINTGASCSTTSGGYFVRVFTLNGNYYGGGDWVENAIVWTGEKTGVATVPLNANSIYMFKVYDNDQKTYGSGTGNYIVQSGDNKDCGSGDSDIRLFTGPEGDYTFTVDITNADAGSPYVNVVTGYPSVTHPVAGYSYFEKPSDWTNVYLYWYTSDSYRLTDWNGAPEITATASICGTTYYYAPIGTTFSNVIFKGNGTNQWTTISTTGCSSKYLDKTVYASPSWATFYKYSITFAGNGNSGGSMTDVEDICPGASETLAANGYTKTGYNFSGWKTNVAVTANGNSIAANGIVPAGATISSIGSNITLTAQWTAKETTVTLDNQSATTAGASEITATYDAAVPTIAANLPVKTGYTFGGYYTAVDGGGTKYINADGSSAKNWDIEDATKTLYAKWTVKTTTVSFNQNGGDGGQTSSLTATYGSAMPTPITKPTKDGYRFDGYYESSGGTGTKYYNADGTSATNWDKEDATWTLYAKWVDKGCTDKGGTNVISGSTTSNTLGPVAIYNKYSTRQILYTKTDLDLAVGKKGTIKSIYFDYSGDDMAARKITIYMANSALTALSTSNYVPYSSFTQVYTSTTWTCSAGWNEITLDTPFEYNGVGNLVVLIDDNTGSYEFSKYFNTHTANTTTGAQIYKNSDTSPGEDPSTTNWTTYTLSNSRPKTKFCIEVSDMEEYTVNWHVNGTIEHSQTGYEGTTLTSIPTPVSGDCDGEKEFVGWYSDEYTHATDAPDFVEPEVIPNGGADYYAVFATAGSSSTATFPASDLAGLTEDDTYWMWTHDASGIEFWIEGTRYTSKTPYTFSINANGSADLVAPNNILMTAVDVTITESTYKVNSVSSGWSLSTDGTSQSITSSGSRFLEMNATTDYQIRITTFTVTYKPYTNFSTTCCTQRNITLASSGSVTGGTFNSGGVAKACATREITLTATPSNSGYVFNGWTVTNSSTSANVTTTVLGAGHANDNPATMTMPDYNVTVTAAFSAISGISVKTAPTKTVYLEGETFDPTGLVITATYANSATVDVPYSGNEALFILSPTTATALTTENASVSITYNGQTTSQSITVYSVTLQALDENGDAIRVGGPAAPTRDGTTVTKAANVDNYVYKEWVVSGATLADGANANQKIITDPTGAVTVTVKYYLPRVVKWMVNGEEWKPYTDTGSGTDGTAEVARGAQWKTLTLPTDPNPLNDEGCGDKFIGWTNAEISGQLDKDDDAAAISTLVDSNLLNSANKSGKTKTINANPYIFYAVFADYVE